jgi:transcriptional regulator with XRE-family HTH domain
MSDTDQADQEFKIAGQRFGQRLRQLRQVNKLSLDALANSAGVNKLTLSKIERGTGNPTLSVVWKIANGLGVPFSSLLKHEMPPQLTRFNQQADMTSPDGQFVAHAMTEMPEQCTFDVQIARIQPGNHYKSQAHSQGVIEIVSLMQGELTVEVQNQSFNLKTMDCLRFCADRPHSYFNSGSVEAVFHCIIAYGQIASDKAHAY